MNPDQLPVPQPTPTPEPNQVPPTPPAAVPSPQPFVVPSQAQVPEQPTYATQPLPQPTVASTSPFGNPIGPISSTVPVAPIIASVPQSGMPMAVPMPMPQKKSKKKLFIVLGAIIAGLAILGVGAWFLIMYIMDHNIALKTYSGDGYSVLVPTDYTADTSDTANVSFKNPKSKDTTTLSKEEIFTEAIPSGKRDAVITALDKAYETKDSLSSSVSSSNDTIDNYSYTKTTQSGQDARRIHADVKDNGKKVGTIDLEVVVGTDKAYFIGVTAYITDLALSNSANKILDSLTIK